MPNANPPDSASRPLRQGLGCATIAALICGAVLLATRYAREQSRLAFEREQAQRRQEAFEKVRSGDHNIFVDDAELLQMLANDAECVKNLTEVVFFMADLTPEYAEHIARLTNVRSIGFYDTDGADYILQHAGELPIEELSFETTPLSDDSLRNLSKFSKLREVHFEQVLDRDAIAILETLRPEVAVRIPYPEDKEPKR